MKFFRSKIFWIIFCLIIVSAYLYFANSYIYWRIDKGNLPKIEHDQTTLIKSSVSSTITYVALGDSLTYGTGAQNYEESFPYLLAKKLSETRGTVVLKNFAFQGATSNDLLASELENAAISNPEIITILIGTNDAHNYVSAKKFSANYEKILKVLSARTKADIYVVGLPSIGAKTIYLPPFNWYFSYKNNQYNEIIKALALDYGAVYVDTNTATKDWKANDGNYSADLFHPSSTGYKIFSKIIYDRISR